LTDDHITLNVLVEALECRQKDPARELVAFSCPAANKKLMFYERFGNQAALDLHLETPFCQKFVEYRKTDDLPIATQTVVGAVSCESFNWVSVPVADLQTNAKLIRNNQRHR
jgi:hypothetical protein